MEVLPIDITAIIAVIMGISIVLVPVIGLTARFALKPLVEAMGGYLGGKETQESVRVLERRMAFLEQQLEAMEHQVERLEEVSEFHRRLDSGQASGSTDAGSDGG